MDWIASARDRWLPRTEDPLRLRVWLRSSAFVFDPYVGIQIEGALQHAVVLRETGRMPSDVFAGYVGDADVPIPIADTPILGYPIARASWGIPGPSVESVRYLRRRADLEAMQPPPCGVVQTGFGPLKPINQPFARLSTPWVDFYVVGDAERLLALAPHLLCLGRKRAMSEILSVDVEVMDDDRALYAHGRPARSIPVAEGTPGARRMTTRAPYYVQRSATWCVVPEPIAEAA